MWSERFEMGLLDDELLGPMAVENDERARPDAVVGDFADGARAELGAAHPPADGEARELLGKRLRLGHRLDDPALVRFLVEAAAGG